ncbi:MAG: purine-nucleoside phosphorylase [Elusimicrobia bacterium]|nr:purine-nucleoside phosphorylase [Elusimicrobiota bacterium]
MIGLVLGSGLGAAVRADRADKAVAFDEIFASEIRDKIPPAGHQRRLLEATYKGKKLVILQGRLHYYEGFPMDLVVEPIRHLHRLGVNTLILTFACGAINRKLRVRDLVVLKDHVHLQSANPLRGTTQFVDCTRVYDEGLSSKLVRLAKKQHLRVFSGVYASTDGPTYETPAEVKAFGRLGADVVGMSVTAEALVAKSVGMRIAAVGWVSNMASGVVPQKNLSHEDVLGESKKVSGPFSQFLLSFIENL